MSVRVALSLLLVGAFGLAGCDGLQLLRKKPPPAPVIVECDPSESICPEVLTPDEDTVRPKHRPGTRIVPDGNAGPGFVEGVEAETLDESSTAEKKEALKTTDTSGEKKLGETIATLGDVAQQGFWLKTSLVIKEREGRIVWAEDGNSVNVTLVPKQGEVTSGSQISLAAMRALGIPLTALAELIVFAR